MPSGHHIFPFQFTFPVNIPPTMAIDYSYTRYRVWCARRPPRRSPTSAKLEKKSKTERLESPLTIHIEYAALKTSDVAQKTKKYGKLPVTLTAYCAKETLYLGEPCEIQVVRRSCAPRRLTAPDD